ncbi:peptidoglycan-binding protein [Streptomyces sp. NPDC014894]|uniref:peptidoglycan-binding protein n=1 Tax=Streptomyces sp. NPDC014894 TaxID=3364931 RepID=UPI0037015783
MTVPVFEEYEPAADCGCPGCARWRRETAAGGRPAAHACRRALVLFTAAGVVLGAGAGPARALERPGPPARTVADAGPEHEQGASGPLHGRPLPGPSAEPAPAPARQTTRAEIIARARGWLAAKVPYSMQAYWTDGYRQDCSGFVSMAWDLARNEWTGSLAQYGVRVERSELRPGDILLFHNPADPTYDSHVTIFGGWNDDARTTYLAYEQAKPHTRRQSTPMAYWNNSDRYVAYRYAGLTDPVTVASGSEAADAYPGESAFGPGANNAHVTRLGELLVARGGQRFYEDGPGPVWGEADRRATEAFQLAQGWSGSDADGEPGPETWRLLVTGQGRDIPPEGASLPEPAGTAVPAGGASAPASAGTAVPAGTAGTGSPAVPLVPAGAADPAGSAGTAVPAGTDSPEGAASTSVPAGPAGAGRPAAGSASATAGGPGSPVADAAAPPYPGRGHFRPGGSGEPVAQLGRRLVERGFGRHYTAGPGPVWGEADRRNVAEFQRAQGWRGAEADGYPGPETWRRLFADGPAGPARAAAPAAPTAAGASGGPAGRTLPPPPDAVTARPGTEIPQRRREQP